MCIESLKCVALAVPEIIAIGVSVWVMNPNLGEEEVVRRGADGTIRKSVGDFLIPIGPPW